MTNVFTVKILSAAGNVFVVSLAFADLVVAFYPYPLVLYAIFHDGWSLGETNCKVCGGGGWQVWLVSNQLIGCRWESLIRLAWFIIKSDSSRLLYRFLPACNHQSRLENLLPRHPCVTRTEGFS
ncbi:uncharacterized protein LOC110972401 isoform X3 [Acanthochromis polyacanthus]|uniref:uncharacterized protein LOC110972401 isoform X3 n=1 Tax=Acanthochromis polyacanthus TaxID=80966 RepID=UPI002234182F|nr:uncharacterized protein LOC110972401 isoform X3 [Acanthochromis polyacanthus]